MKRNGLRTLFVALFLLISLTTIPMQDIHAQEFNFQWGSTGGDNGQFNQPIGIALDSSGNVFVVDTNNNRVQKFDRQGVFIIAWGSNGSGNGQFIAPQAIAIDSSDAVYVADWFNNRIQKFDNNGAFITAWGVAGDANGQFNNPHGVALDSSDNIYVTDFMNNRVQKFDYNGNFITAWGSTGSANGQLKNPRAIAVDTSDPSDRVYVSDASNRIQIFDTDGVYLGTWGTSGRDDGQLIDAMGISLDADGNLFVSEFGNSRVQKWDNSGNYLTKWGIFGKDEGRFDWPYGVAVNNLGDIYVVDSRNNRVQVFIPPQPPTYDSSGKWSYSLTNLRTVEESGYMCEFEENSNGTVTATQNDQYVSLVLDEFTYSGFVSSATSNISGAEYNVEADGIVSTEFMIMLASQTSGSGKVFIAVTDNVGSYCLAEGDLTITKQTNGDGGGGGGNASGGSGGGGGGCFISAIVP